MKLSNATLAALAKEMVPQFRELQATLCVPSVVAVPEYTVTAKVVIDGIESRLRVKVEVDPEDDPAG